MCTEENNTLFSRFLSMHEATTRLALNYADVCEGLIRLRIYILYRLLQHLKSDRE